MADFASEGDTIKILDVPLPSDMEQHVGYEFEVSEVGSNGAIYVDSPTGELYILPDEYKIVNRSNYRKQKSELKI